VASVLSNPAIRSIVDASARNSSPIGAQPVT
jgi:hypothetical protein